MQPTVEAPLVDRKTFESLDVLLAERATPVVLEGQGIAVFRNQAIRQGLRCRDKARPRVFDGHRDRLVQSVGRDAPGRRIESIGRSLEHRHDSGSASRRRCGYGIAPAAGTACPIR